MEFPCEKRASTVLDALKPETETSPTRRAKVDVRREGRSLTFFFKAKDTTALRASVNSYARWVMVIEEVLAGIESFQ